MGRTASIPELVTSALAQGGPQEEQTLGAKGMSESGGEGLKQSRNSGWEVARNHHRWRGQGQVEAMVIPWEDRGVDRGQSKPTRVLVEKHRIGHVCPAVCLIAAFLSPVPEV